VVAVVSVARAETQFFGVHASCNGVLSLERN